MVELRQCVTERTRRSLWARVPIACVLLVHGCGGQADGTDVSRDEHFGEDAGVGAPQDDDAQPAPEQDAGQGSGAKASDDGEKADDDVPGCSGAEPCEDAGPGDTQTTTLTPPDGEPIYTRIQRLTNSQWEHAVTDLLRLEAPTNLSQGLPAPVVGLYSFTNNEQLLTVGTEEFVSYELAAEAAAALATSSTETLSAIYAGTDPDGFISDFGRRAFRRPLSDAEVAKYREAYDLGEALYGSGFDSGAALVIRTLLQSPHFLYRTELGPPGEMLDGYEVAAKLALWLLDTTPSDALLDAADAGELDSVDGIASAAREMLGQPEAFVVMREFHRQLYGLGEIDNIVKESPEFTPELQEELKESSYAFFDRVFESNQGLREILTSPRWFVGPELSALLDLDDQQGGVAEIESRDGRLGYFLQPPLLMVHAFDETPNLYRRGANILRNVLCAGLPLPPDMVPPSFEEIAEDETNRAHAVALTTPCGGVCHETYINPMGFAFENYDGLGRWRTLDNDIPVDASGSYPFAEGTKTFNNAAELMELLQDSREAHECYAKNMSEYGLQRELAAGDQPLVAELADISRTGSLKELAVALVTSPNFLKREGSAP